MSLSMMTRPRFTRRTTKIHYPHWHQAFSADSLRRAWLTVRAKNGAAAGGESVAQFEANLTRNLAQLRGELLEEAYRPKPVTQILVPKPHDRWRPITLWAVRDRVVQRAVYDYLDPIWDPRFLTCSHGFRTGYSTHTAAQAIHDAQQRGYRWVLDADIKDCFGSMSDRVIHNRLHEWHVPGPLTKLFAHWLTARIHNAWRGRTTAGTSQGGVISPLLCNLYLHSLDRAMQQRQWCMVRYADDFVVLARSERAVKSAHKHAAHTLKQLSLQIHPQKTRLTTVEEGFQFAGWFFLRDEMHQLK